MSRKQQLKVRGIVIENERGAVQPEAFLRLQTPKNEAVTVIYHSEFPPAVNYHAGDVGFHLREGDEVEIFASVVGDKLSTCPDNHYYIRKLA